MMWDAQIIEQFALRQMPNEQRERLLGFIATDKNSAKCLQIHLFIFASGVDFNSIRLTVHRPRLAVS